MSSLPSERGGAKVALSGATVAHAQTPADDPDPNFLPNPDAVPDEYVVTFADGAYTPPDIVDPDAPPTGTPPASGTNGANPVPAPPDADTVGGDLCDDYGATFVESYGYGGSFLCTMTEDEARAMSHDARVVCVETNAYVYPCGATDAQDLDRIDQRQYPLDGQYNVVNDGNNVDVYEVGTGVWTGGTDFVTNGQSRVVSEFPTSHYNSGAIKNPDGTICTSSNDDLQHGTLVASVIGGNTYGVAKRVKIHAIKVLGGDHKGNLAGVAAGLSYLIGHPASKASHRRSVINMSISFAIASQKPGDVNSVAADVKKLTAAGVVVVVAAGNNQANAALYSPSCLSATIPGVITVGGSTTEPDPNTGINVDYPAFYNAPGMPATNYGSCVDLFAPSTRISTISYYDDNHGVRHEYAVHDPVGTSFASPLVAGFAALSLQTYWGNTPAQVKTLIVNASTKAANFGNAANRPIDFAYYYYSVTPAAVNAGTPNRLLYVGGY